jgi:uncharacterized damage-inducible protein DinB
MLQYTRTLWDYNYWAHHKLWNCIETISDSDFVKPVAYPVGSVHVQVVHVMWAEAVWYERIHHRSRPTFTADDYSTRPVIREKWDQIESHWRAYLARTTEDDLRRELEITPLRGQPYSCTVQEMLLHAVNHGTNHRAQILQLIDSHGGETFEQDLSSYYRERQQRN